MIKFSKKEEGVISVVIHRKEECRVFVSIKDNGRGIDPDVLPKLFTKFVSKSETGGIYGK